MATCFAVGESMSTIKKQKPGAVAE
jgi:hypothetical protein